MPGGVAVAPCRSSHASASSAVNATNSICDGAPARPGDGRVEPPQRLVRRHEHEHAQALADQAVDDVEQPRQALPGPLLRVGGEQLAGVLEDQQAPALSSSSSSSSRTSSMYSGLEPKNVSGSVM